MFRRNVSCDRLNFTWVAGPECVDTVWCDVINIVEDVGAITDFAVVIENDPNVGSDVEGKPFKKEEPEDVLDDEY